MWGYGHKIVPNLYPHLVSSDTVPTDRGGIMVRGMTHAWLFVVGVVIEGVAIIVFAAPDLLPGLRRLSAWLAPRLRRFENWLRRLLHLRRRPVVHQVSAGGAIAVGGHARGIVSVNPDASLEEKVEYLIRREQVAQDVADRLSERIEAVASSLSDRVAALPAETRAHVSTELQAAVEADRPLRLIGALLLVVGLACQSVASLL